MALLRSARGTSRPSTTARASSPTMPPRSLELALHWAARSASGWWCGGEISLKKKRLIWREVVELFDKFLMFLLVFSGLLILFHSF